MDARCPPAEKALNTDALRIYAPSFCFRLHRSHGGSYVAVLVGEAVAVLVGAVQAVVQHVGFITQLAVITGYIYPFVLVCQMRVAAAGANEYGRAVGRIRVGFEAQEVWRLIVFVKTGVRYLLSRGIKKKFFLCEHRPGH